MQKGCATTSHSGRRQTVLSSLAAYKSPSCVIDVCRLWSGRANSEACKAVLENRVRSSIPLGVPKECCSLESCACAQIISAQTLSTTRCIPNKRSAPEPPSHSSECLLRRSLFQEDRLPAQ